MISEKIDITYNGAELGNSIYKIYPSQSPFKDDVAFKIQDFIRIEENEFYGNSPKISLYAIQTAIELNEEAWDLAKDAIPTLTGGVVFVVYLEKYRYEFIIKADGKSIDFLLEENDELISEMINIDILKAKEVIAEIHTKCNSLESFIGEVGKKKSAGSQVLRFLAGAIKPSQSSHWIVLNHMAQQSVNTSGSITPNTIHRPSIGFSMRKSLWQNAQIAR